MKLIRLFYKEQTIKRKAPVNFKAADLLLFGETSCNFKSSGLYYIKNARVSSIGIIYKRFQSLKRFIICYSIDFEKYRFRYFLKLFLFAKKIKLNPEENYIIVFDNYSGPKGFAHWICDGLTRIAEINEDLKNYTVLLPEYFKNEKLYNDSLSFFKINKIEYLKSDTLTTVPNLFVPSYPAPTGNFIPANIKKIRDIVLPQIPQKPINNVCLYISRARTNRRFVENEEEICKCLSERNFKIIYSEEYSFKEQLQLVNGAKIIVSIHGAALALAMFMKEGAHLLEFRKENDSINNMYYSLCCSADINYSYLLCKVKEISDTGNNFNLIVDPVELKLALDNIK